MQYKTATKLKEERLEALFQDCRSTIVNQMLSSFGLNQGMFTDRDGGNVTTLHNFEREDDTYVADKDKDSHKQSQKDYDRSDYAVSQDEWKTKKDRHKKDGIDGYTNKNENPDNMDLDHIQSLKNAASDKKNHLAYETGTEQGKEDLKEILNSDINLVATNKSINRRKGAKSNTEFVNGSKRKAGESDEQYSKRQTDHEQKLKDQCVDKELMLEKEKKAQKELDKAANKKLIKKQTVEVMTTGAKQAGSMALKQAMGMLLTEFVNIIFTEIKIMRKSELQFNIEGITELKNRVALRLKDLMQKTPDILKDACKGGVSGFMSNLLTFLINNLLSTAKRFVTIIREGLLGIYKAIKMVLFPPKNMTTEEVWRNAIKLLSTTVISAIILSFKDVITGFISTVPILLPIADILSIALVGILSGVISAFVAYTIDSIIDKFCDRHDEKMIDLLMEDSQTRIKMSEALEEQLQVSLAHMELNKQAISNYEHIKHQQVHISQSFHQTNNNNYDIYSNNIKIEEKAVVLKQKIDGLSESVDVTTSQFDELSNLMDISVKHVEKTVIHGQEILENMTNADNHNKSLIEKTNEFISSNEEFQCDFDVFLKGHKE